MLVVAIALLISVGAGTPATSLQKFGPLVPFAFPLLILIGDYWDGWPGTRFGPRGLILNATLLLAGSLGLQAIVDATAGPSTPLATLAFVATLQVSTVGENWPVGRLGKRTTGLAGVGLAWALALMVNGALRGQESSEVNTAAIVVGVFQVVFFVLWRGWPFALIQHRPIRLLTANAVTIGGGVLVYLSLRALGQLSPEQIGAGAGVTIAAALLTGILPTERSETVDGGRRFELSAVTAGVACVLAAGLGLVARASAWPVPEDAFRWIGHVGLSAIGFAVLFHVTLGKRWPGAVRFAADRDAKNVASLSQGLGLAATLVQPTSRPADQPTSRPPDHPTSRRG